MVQDYSTQWKQMCDQVRTSAETRAQQYPSLRDGIMAEADRFARLEAPKDENEMMSRSIAADGLQQSWRARAISMSSNQGLQNVQRRILGR